MKEDSEMITLSEAEKRTGIPARTLRHAAQRGLLKAKRFGRTWVTTPAAVETYQTSSRLHRPER